MNKKKRVNKVEVRRLRQYNVLDLLENVLEMFGQSIDCAEGFFCEVDGANGVIILYAVDVDGAPDAKAPRSLTREVARLTIGADRIEDSKFWCEYLTLRATTHCKVEHLPEDDEYFIPFAWSGPGWYWWNALGRTHAGPFKTEDEAHKDLWRTHEAKQEN